MLGVVGRQHLAGARSVDRRSPRVRRVPQRALALDSLDVHHVGAGRHTDLHGLAQRVAQLDEQREAAVLAPRCARWRGGRTRRTAAPAGSHRSRCDRAARALRAPRMCDGPCSSRHRCDAASSLRLSSGASESASMMSSAIETDCSVGRLVCAGGRVAGIESRPSAADEAPVEGVDAFEQRRSAATAAHARSSPASCAPRARQPRPRMPRGACVPSASLALGGCDRDRDERAA